MKDGWNNYTDDDKDSKSHDLDDNYINVSDIGHDIDLPDFSLRANRNANRRSSGGRDRVRGNLSDVSEKRKSREERNSKKITSYGTAHKKTADSMAAEGKGYPEKKSERGHQTYRGTSEKNSSSYDMTETTKRTVGYGSVSDVGGLLSTIAERKKTESISPGGKKNSSYGRKNSSHSKKNSSYVRKNSSHSKRNSSYEGKNSSYSRENSPYSKRNRSYSTEKDNLPVSFDGNAVKKNETAEYQKPQSERRTKSAVTTGYERNFKERAAKKTRSTVVKSKRSTNSTVNKNNSRISTDLSRQESVEHYQDDKHRATETVSVARRQRISNKKLWMAVMAVVIAAVVVVVFRTVVDYNSYLDLQAEKESLQAVYEEQLELSEELKEEEEYVQTDDYIEEMARKMGLLYPNEVIFKPEE